MNVLAESAESTAVAMPHNVQTDKNDGIEQLIKLAFIVFPFTDAGDATIPGKIEGEKEEPIFADVTSDDATTGVASTESTPCVSEIEDSVSEREGVISDGRSDCLSDRRGVTAADDGLFPAASDSWLPLRCFERLCSCCCFSFISES